MFEQILPEGTAVSEVRGDLAESPLFPEEAEVIARAVEKRRREFRTGRACARAALGQLGIEPQAIPAGSRGAPQWPAEVVGSITHCDGFRAAALAHRTDLVAVGIDAELDAALPDGVLGDVALGEERLALELLAREEPQVSWDRLLFSIKESIYKAWFPLAERWLGFEDAQVTIDRDRRSFAARLLVPGPRLQGDELRGFSGRWLAHDGLLLAAIAVPARVAWAGAQVGADRTVGEE